MKKVLILGAGLVARPLVNYLLEQPEIHITVADLFIEKAEKLVGSNPKGAAIQLNAENQDVLKSSISETDVVISLLPWTLHIKVAELCLEFKKHLVTASYVKPEMQALDSTAKKHELLFLNELGVDPGIDHMAAMKVINSVKDAGGDIISFYSYCGGLPALSNNNNPLGYKFSWSPVGVMLAATNEGRYLKDGNVIEVNGEQLFEHYWLVDVPGSATFEAYINRDALPYIDIYNIKNIKSMYRGTLRNISHCESWNYFKKLGLLNQELIYDFTKISPCEVLAALIQSDGKNLIKDIAAFLKVADYSVAIKKLEWLGLLSTEKLPLKTMSVFDMFSYVLQKKLVYHENEVDLLVQHHEFIAEYPNDKKEMITSTMVEEGIPGGDSAMARTVSLPVAIATKLIVEGKINLAGVHIPVLAQIYEPILSELEVMNIKLIERKQSL